MKKLFILSILFLFIVSCNFTKVEPIKETHNSNNFIPDTVKIVNLNHFTGTGLYDKHCKMCHGNFGKGDGIKARTFKFCPYDLSKVNKTDKEIYYIVLDGIDSISYKMPNQHELSSDDIWLIIFRIKKFKVVE
jgi:hypothetical protein